MATQLAERVPLARLTPAPWNPRLIRDARFANLCKSIEADPGFLEQRPILATADGTIYAGNMRYRAVQHLGWPDVPAIVADIPEQLAKERALRDNAQWGDWQDDDLAALLYDLQQQGSELDLLGFEDDALTRLLESVGGMGDTPVGDGSGASPDDAPLFGHEEIIEAAFRHFRAIGFPYRRLPIHVCMQEINKLAATEPESLIRTDVGFHVADTYHPHRFHAAADGMKSPFHAFTDDDMIRKAMRLALENGYRVPAGFWTQLNIVSGTQACSNFRPGFACYLYRRFCRPGMTVLDTSTGYGGRLVGFMASGIAGRYIGIDPNEPTHEGNLQMAADLGFSDRVDLHNLPAEDVPHETVRGRCDFAFTSPPYFSKEHYSDDDSQSWVRYRTGDEWRAGFLMPMLALQHAALKPGAHAIVNIADVTVRGKRYPLADWTIDSALAAGFEHVGSERFEMTQRFGAGQADEVAAEPVLIFKKAAV